MRQARDEVRAVRQAATPAHLHLRERLIAIGLFSIVVDLVGSTIVFMFERHAPGTKITTAGDALFWTSTQLLTVSSQLPNPISAGGRITDVFLQFYAISVVAALAGSFGAFFNRRSLERHPLEPRSSR